jgi:DNA-directed RNA polymerase sigma subunit (sigma70/sigma32)
LAGEIGLSVEQVRRAREVAHVVASLDQPVGDDAVLGELVGADRFPSAEKAVVEAVAREALHRAVDGLPPFDRAVGGPGSASVTGWRRASPPPPGG